VTGHGTSPGTWAGRRVLVTGDTGFKGTWLVLWLRRLGADVVGIGLPPPDPQAIGAAVDMTASIEHHDLDVRDARRVRALVAQVAPSVVFHLAGQATVRRGYAEPLLTYETNVLGTANVLAAVEAVESPTTVDAVVVVTSDKVYRQDGPPGGRAFVETDPLGGDDPYSASKACAELVVAEWRRRNPGVAVATARAGNVVGGGDRGVDRLIPDVVRSVEAGRAVVVRNPTARRPWQHVLDALDGYLRLAGRLLEGGAPGAVNFGPRASPPVADVVDRFVAALGSGSWTHDDAPLVPHPSEAPALALDPGLAARTLGWTARLDLDTALAWTAGWYRAQLAGDDLLAPTLDQLDQYVDLPART
jgi:CDP-glucose 4,6-dehydratase